MDRSAEDVVRAFLACFEAPNLEAVLAFFSADAAYEDPRPGAACKGIDALREEFGKQIRAVPTTELRIKTLVSDGKTVMLERREHFILNGKTVEMEGALVFEVNRAGQITRMRDYHDRGQFSTE